MRKILGLVVLLALVPALGGMASCSSTQTSTQAAESRMKMQRDLMVAEYAFQAALKAIEVEVVSGRLRGTKAGTVRKAVAAAKGALDVARVAVDQGKVDALTAVSAAVSATAVVLELYK